MSNPAVMPAATKTAWVAALRSGEYKQGTQKLYKSEEDSYCCLGVLCRVLGQSPEDIDYISLPEDSVMRAGGIQGVRIGSIPLDVKPYMGRVSDTNDAVAVMTYREGTVSFADMNDLFRMTFAEIADVIEAHVETY